VDARNRGEQLVHAVEKSLKELGDKVDGGERAKVESTLSDLRGVLKGDDKAAIDKKFEALLAASSNIAQQAAAAAQGGAGAGPGPESAGGADAGGSAKSGGNNDAVDAEFEEVKDKKKAS
jgi:molecular chaperone DnaK